MININNTIEADVLVIGGGTAGFGAAIAAARKGLDVYLLEASNKIGGVMSSCPGMPWGAAYPCDRSIGGIMEELANRLYKMSPPAAVKRICSLEEFGPEILYDHDIAIHNMYQMLSESGVNLLLSSIALDVKMCGSKINSVIFSDRQGLHEIKSKIYIDCSGDGDIAHRAGVPYDIGDRDKNMMGASMVFTMIDADWKMIFDENDDPYFTKYSKKGIAEKRIHEDLYKLYIMKGFHNDTVYFNSVIVGDVDGREPTDITKKSEIARKRCFDLIDFVRTDIPGFENSRAINVGPIVGIRETRKFHGQYRLTGEDIAMGTKFEDGIVACDNPVDDVFRGSNVMTHDSIVDQGVFYTIPFRTMVPEKIENLMFAGRIISTDPVAFASVRGMPQCMLMGQACGTAAYQAITADMALQNIDRDILVMDLIEQGVKGIGGRPL